MNSDITCHILSYLPLIDLQKVLDLCVTQTTQAYDLCIDRKCLKMRSPLRIPWAINIFEKRKYSLVHGPCCVFDCEGERLAIFDLTTPVYKTHVLSPYCSVCTKWYTNGLAHVLNSPYTLRN
jgi:hypothetical protein